MSAVSGNETVECPNRGHTRAREGYVVSVLHDDVPSYSRTGRAEEKEGLEKEIVGDRKTGAKNTNRDNVIFLLPFKTILQYMKH